MTVAELKFYWEITIAQPTIQYSMYTALLSKGTFLNHRSRVQIDQNMNGRHMLSSTIYSLAI